MTTEQIEQENDRELDDALDRDIMREEPGLQEYARIEAQVKKQMEEYRLWLKHKNKQKAKRRNSRVA